MTLKKLIAVKIAAVLIISGIWLIVATEKKSDIMNAGAYQVMISAGIIGIILGVLILIFTFPANKPINNP